MVNGQELCIEANTLKSNLFCPKNVNWQLICVSTSRIIVGCPFHT